MDIISGMYELVKALFSTFADAVSSYPFTTLLVFAFLLYWMVDEDYIRLPKWWDRESVPHFGAKDAFFIAVWFILSTILAHFVGAIFGFVMSALGAMLQFTGGTLEPFKAHPLPFTVILLIFSAIALAIVMLGTRGKSRNKKVVAAFCVAFVVLILTYIATTLYVALEAAFQSPPP